jgi:hypothetical protein
VRCWAVQYCGMDNSALWYRALWYGQFSSAVSSPVVWALSFRYRQFSSVVSAYQPLRYKPSGSKRTLQYSSNDLVQR